MNDRLQDVLFHGEEVLWEGKPNKLCYVLSSFGKLLPVALVFLLFDGFIIGSVFSFGLPPDMWIFMVFFFAFHLMPVWLCVGKVISSNVEYKNIVYAATSRRLISRSGFVGVDFESVDYADINSIRVNVSLFERMLRVGSLVITTSSGSRLVFHSVLNPYALYKKINKIFVDLKSDIYYPNAYRPDINSGYQTKYES